MASKKSHSTSDGTSNHSNDEKTLLQEKPPIPPDKNDIPLGASSLNPTGIQIPTSTPKDKEKKWENYPVSEFFTEDGWKTRRKHIESLNPKERGRDRQQALQHFKRLLHREGTELEQENVEATWRSLNKYFYHVQFSMSTTTATREDAKQLEEMEEQLAKFKEEFQIGINLGDEHTSEAQDEILRHELKFPGHIRTQENPSVGHKLLSEATKQSFLADWIKRVPERQTDAELFEMATNNFLLLFRKQVEAVLETDSAPEGFLDIVQLLEKSYQQIETIFYNMKQSERDQEIMVFIDHKYKDVKDHVAMLEQMEQEELVGDEKTDGEIESIINELNEFANNPNYRPRSELAYLLCSWISQEGVTQLSKEQDDELARLLKSFGKDRLKLTLHLWKSRLCESQSETHKKMSRFLSGLLETWSEQEAEENDQGAEGNGSTWAAHATRFTRGIIPNSSLNEKFSIFLDPRHREEELSGNDAGEDATLQQRPIEPRRQQTAAPHGTHFDGLGITQRSGYRPQGAPRRARTTTPSRTPQQTSNVTVDQMERLIASCERRTTSNVNNHPALKLPPIKLQPFDGNPLEWVNWWPRYEALIHNRHDISESHKLLFLQQYVTEKAAKELWGAKLETLPYHKAVSLLFEKFADKQLLTAVYRDQLKKVQIPKNARDMTGMRNFVDTVKKYMNCLREFQMEPHSYSLSTMDFYREKMPDDVQFALADQEGKRISHLSLVEFVKALTKYVDLREDTSRFKEHVGVRNHNNGNTTTMVTQTGQNKDGNYKLPPDFLYYKCLYCGVGGVGGHLMMDCPTVKDPKKRFLMIKELQRCTSCLSKNHRYTDCPSQKSCFCLKKHHTSLHYWFARNLGGNQTQGNRQNQQGGGSRGQNNQSQPAGN